LTFGDAWGLQLLTGTTTKPKTAAQISSQLVPISHRYANMTADCVPRGGLRVSHPWLLQLWRKVLCPQKGNMSSFSLAKCLVVERIRPDAWYFLPLLVLCSHSLFSLCFSSSRA
jgi:hypothetical protein